MIFSPYLLDVILHVISPRYPNYFANQFRISTQSIATYLFYRQQSLFHNVNNTISYFQSLFFLLSFVALHHWRMALSHKHIVLGGGGSFVFSKRCVFWEVYIDAFCLL